MPDDGLNKIENGQRKSERERAREREREMATLCRVTPTTAILSVATLGMSSSALVEVS